MSTPPIPSLTPSPEGPAANASGPWVAGAPGVRSRASQVWGRGRGTPKVLVVVGAILILFLVVMAIAPGAFTRASPTDLYSAAPLSPPSLSHWLGTDEVGRDYFARIVHGAYISLVISVLVVAIGLVVGVTVGLLAGLAPTWFDSLLMRVVDMFLCFPGFVLAMALAAVLGRGERSLIIALGVVWWPPYARLIRGMTIALRHRLHVESARAIGAGKFRLARKHIVPFMWTQLNARVTQDLGYALLNVAGLSFLGLGAQPPTPEWGALLESGLNYVGTAWWLPLFPGVVITLWTLGTALLGDGIAAFTRSGGG